MCEVSETPGRNWNSISGQVAPSSPTLGSKEDTVPRERKKMTFVCYGI